MSQFRFIEPIDTLFLRGNKLFGDPGDYGLSEMPPKPSVFAGAIRSALLAHKNIDFREFADGKVADDELGTPDRPGSFRVLNSHIATQTEKDTFERMYTLPHDLLVLNKSDEEIDIQDRIKPQSIHKDISSSLPLRLYPVLQSKDRSKPVSGYLMNQEGWKAHIKGERISCGHLIHEKDLWKKEIRVGIGLDSDTRAAAEGKLYSTQAIVLNKIEHSCDSHNQYSTGFLVELEGVKMPDKLMLRLGGDGRGALCTRCEPPLASDDSVLGAIVKTGKCRLILTSPGIFSDGWRLTGIRNDTDDSMNFEIGDVKGRLVCACIPRTETISGFDIAKNRPKTAERVAPTGSIYWLEGINATVEALRKLAINGLWIDSDDNPMRRVEGFNRFEFAVY